MKQILKNVILSITVLLSSSMFASCASGFDNFITVQKDKLKDGKNDFRFISFNIPNLHYAEDYLPFEKTNPWRLPDEFEIRDALTTIKQLGGKATRMYVLSVRSKNDAPEIIRHVEAPNQFNEDAFRALDKVLQIANEVGVRVIIPLVDNWQWWGGPREYAAFREKEKDEFWTDSLLISDFKKTIDFVISRKNSYTGVLYKNDKAILAWETGNELDCPFEWTKEIAGYIKSLDTNHLLIQGIRGVDLTQEAIDDPNLDILTTHHYGNPKYSLEKIIANQQKAVGKKPYFIGEYGIIPTKDIEEITDTIINQNLAGGMLWSIRNRNREGGFYHHYEYNNFESYRGVGYSNGNMYDEKTVLDFVRQKAFQIDGQPVPPLPKPEKPLLLDIQNVSEISWQGSAGASSYIIERREEKSDWGVIADSVDESKYQYRPLFSDETAEFGKAYRYRIKAKNESGHSDYSNIVGPVEVTSKKVIDELEDLNKVFKQEGELQLLTFEDLRKAKEDRSRLTGKEGSAIIYRLPEVTKAMQIDFFQAKDSAVIQALAGENLDSFVELKTEQKVFGFGNNEYGFFPAVRFSSDTLPLGIKFLKIILTEGIQISRIEFSYSK